MTLKKIFMFAIASIVLLGCKANTKTNSETNNMKDKKILVAFFSYSGTTKRFAQKIAQQTGVDVFEIEAKQPYTSEDVDWTNDNSRVNSEMKVNPDSRPEIAKKMNNLEQYDVVFLGFPIWWYIEPNIINTFLETQNFKGKTIVPFFTAYSSGPGETDKHLQKSINYDVVWKPATRVDKMNDAQLKEWINKSLQ